MLSLEDDLLYTRIVVLDTCKFTCAENIKTFNNEVNTFNNIDIRSSAVHSIDLCVFRRLFRRIINPQRRAIQSSKHSVLPLQQDIRENVRPHQRMLRKLTIRTPLCCLRVIISYILVYSYKCVVVI